MPLTRINNQALTNVTSDGIGKIAGEVIQTKRVNATSTATIATSSQSFNSSGISVSITPKKANSIIYVDYIGSMGDSASAAYMQTQMWIKVGSGSASAMTGSGTYTVGYQEGTKNRYAPFVCSSKYTATSTDEITFYVYFKSGDGNSCRIAHDGSSYSITATEVAV